jgi:programmed cell death protein 5
MGMGAAGGVDPAEFERIEQLKKMVMRDILTKEARERLARVKMVKPDLALQLELYLVQLYQTGKLRTKLTDEQLKAILESLVSEKKFKIIKK